LEQVVLGLIFISILVFGISLFEVKNAFIFILGFGVIGFSILGLVSYLIYLNLLNLKIKQFAIDLLILSSIFGAFYLIYALGKEFKSAPQFVSYVSPVLAVLVTSGLALFIRFLAHSKGDPMLLFSLSSSAAVFISLYFFPVHKAHYELSDVAPIVQNYFQNWCKSRNQDCRPDTKMVRSLPSFKNLEFDYKTLYKKYGGTNRTIGFYLIFKKKIFVNLYDVAESLEDDQKENNFERFFHNGSYYADKFWKISNSTTHYAKDIEAPKDNNLESIPLVISREIHWPINEEDFMKYLDDINGTDVLLITSTSESYEQTNQEKSD
jgi:hypothetical protein